MRRFPSSPSRLDPESELRGARRLNVALAAACAGLALASLGAVSVISRGADAAVSRTYRAAEVASRSAYVECGAFDVTVTGHDAASAGDAWEAAMAYFGADCKEVGTGFAPALNGAR